MSAYGRTPLTSSYSLCKDRGWFIDYTPFDSVAGTIYDDTKMAVAGVGTVVLPVEKSPDLSGPDARGELTLHTVLHCPSTRCNIVSLQPLLQEGDYKGTFGSSHPRSSGSIITKDGSPVTYFDAGEVLFQIKLSGPPEGKTLGNSVLHHGEIYLINVRWSDYQRARWEAVKQGRDPDTVPKPQADEGPARPAGILSVSKLLEEHGGGAFHF